MFEWATFDNLFTFSQNNQHERINKRRKIRQRAVTLQRTRQNACRLDKKNTTIARIRTQKSGQRCPAPGAWPTEPVYNFILLMLNLYTICCIVQNVFILIFSLLKFGIPTTHNIVYTISFYHFDCKYNFNFIIFQNFCSYYKWLSLVLNTNAVLLLHRWIIIIPFVAGSRYNIFCLFLYIILRSSDNVNMIKDAIGLFLLAYFSLSQ